ncbi:MAG: hypothetical protein LQ347_003672 [Umbilicaria vellea]|nr:MAG: hypothetical protein LQ347_003672 [Umbilicaria vellea]
MRTSSDVVISTRLLIYLSCRKSLELHDKRHREIAVFVQRIRRLDDAITISSPLSTKKRKTRKSENTERSSTATDCIEEELVEGDAEWADSSTIYEDDIDFKRLCSSNAKENRSTKKSQRAEKKIAKNQMRVQIVSTEDIAQISQALHPFTASPIGETHAGRHENGDGQGLWNNSTIDANIAFNTSTFRYASLRQNIAVKKLAKAQGIGTPKTPEENVSWQDDPQIVETVGRLNIAVATCGPSSRKRKTLLSRLCHAIHSDLLIMENEDRDTMMRMAGYWRYVNRRTYNAMVRYNHLWDWATGAKLEEIEEVDEENGGDEDQESLAKGPETQEVDADDCHCPVESYDADFMFKEPDSSLLILRKSVVDEEGPIGGEFEGKADTRHLTGSHRRASSPPEPISPCLRYQTKAATHVFSDEVADDVFAATDSGREYYDKYHDYNFSEDLDYYRKQSPKHPNSASKSLGSLRPTKSRIKPTALTSTRRRVLKSTTPKTTAPTAPTPQGITPKIAAPKALIASKVTLPKATTTPKAQSPEPAPPKAKVLRITIPKIKTSSARSPRANRARTKSVPPATRQGGSYAAAVREGVKKT